MEVFLVYLWLKLDLFILTEGFKVFCGLAAIFWIFAALPTFIEGSSFTKLAYKKYCKLFWIPILVYLTFVAILPTPKQTAALVGTYYAVKLVNSPEGVKVGSLIRKKANEYLDQELKGK